MDYQRLDGVAPDDNPTTAPCISQISFDRVLIYLFANRSYCTNQLVHGTERHFDGFGNFGLDNGVLLAFHHLLQALQNSRVGITGKTKPSTCGSQRSR
jgi:hypothetical protein